MTDNRSRRPAPLTAVTLGHIAGCRDLLVYCASGWLPHSATMNADWLPDETLVRGHDVREWSAPDAE